MSPERPVRVSLPIWKYPPVFSGMGIQIQRSLPFLRARGVEVTILTSRLPRSTAPAPHEANGLVDRVLAPGPGRLATLQRVAQFRRYFETRRGAFDVLHCDLHGWEFLLNVGRLKAEGLPIIFEMVLLDGDDPVATAKERMGRFKMRVLAHVDIWVGISGAFLPRVLAAGIPGERFRLVHPGVDVRVYRPLTPEERRATRARLGLPVDSRIAVSAGSVIRRKGIDRLLNAWTRIAPVPGRDLLLIVGPADARDGLTGPDLAFAREMRDASRALGGTVQFIGRAPNVHDYFGAADLFLLLSRQEGLPIVGAEALAAGLPSVVSPLDGIDELVLEGKTGFIIHDPDDAGAVSSVVSRLLAQPRERAVLSGHARAMALARFSFDARADTLASLYRELAARRPVAQ
jgi:glycosyltransferase involved in cell wall biosynthesis